MGGEWRTGGREAKPFLLVAAALKARGQGCFQAWLGSWAHQRECWPLERLVFRGSGSQWEQQRVGGEGRGRLGLVSAVPACHLDRSWSLLLPTRWGKNALGGEMRTWRKTLGRKVLGPSLRCVCLWLHRLLNQNLTFQRAEGPFSPWWACALDFITAPSV